MATHYREPAHGTHPRVRGRIRRVCNNSFASLEPLQALKEFCLGELPSLELRHKRCDLARL